MRTKVKRTSAETALMRIMDALAQEAIEAPDEELSEVASDLRMDLNSRESSAFAGLTYFARPQLSEFFEMEMPRGLQPEHRQRRSKRSQISTERKPPKK